MSEMLFEANGRKLSVFEETPLPQPLAVRGRTSRT